MQRKRSSSVRGEGCIAHHRESKKRKQEEVEHPFLQEKMALGLLWHVQALLRARHIRGDLDGYPPYIKR